MKKLISKLSFIMALILVVTSSLPTQAATAPAKPSGIKIQTGVYYKYWNAHRSALRRAGKFQGDGYDAQISWKAASRATGYVVKIYWMNPGFPKHTTTVTVKKASGGRYLFSTKGRYAYGHYTNLICKDTKTFIYKGSSKKFYSKSLSFHVDGNGSDPFIDKIVIKSFRTVNGKKVYSPAVTKKAKRPY